MERAALVSRLVSRICTAAYSALPLSTVCSSHLKLQHSAMHGSTEENMLTIGLIYVAVSTVATGVVLAACKVSGGLDAARKQSVIRDHSLALH